MEVIAQYGTILLTIGVIFGLYMTWGIGANDVANVMGTSVGSGAITVTTAIIIAGIFEFAGAALAGGHVTATIRKGIIDPTPIVNTPEVLIFGMLAALLAAAVWLMIASSRGWPVSTTHSIVGAVVGVGLLANRAWTSFSSQSTIVDRRCAMTSVVRPFINSASPSWICRSDFVSSADVASSRINTGASLSSARPIAIR